MYNLPLESKLDIFKYLNINQLTSVRQTNYYFNALIGRYEGELARKKFYKIGISDFFKDSNDTFINLEDGLFKLKITDKLMEKFIETSKDYSNMAKDVEFVFCFWPIFNLSERAEFIKREQGSVGWQYFYQLTNQNNPKVKFSILYIVRNELISHFKIVRIS
uniref:F-box domain-containing protein n=1 Tax=Meloidogyne hapla TaxID=6305 RepID=A0A1I8AYX8_MELHA